VDAKVEEGSEAVMEGVEHLGQYVYEMTKAKVEALKRGEGNGDVSMENGNEAVRGDEDDDGEEDVLVDDPLDEEDV
jgi:intron-binding protein aquarius